MKDVVLSFPSALIMAEFVLDHKIYKVKTDAMLFTLSGVFLDEQIQTACNHYSAIVVQSNPAPVAIAK